MDLETVLGYGISAIVGAFAALVASRTRMAMIEHVQREHTETLKDITRSVRALEKRIERRQIVQLEILADIARAMKLDARVPSDMLTKFLSAGDEDS